MFKVNALPFPGGHAFGVFLLAKKEGVGHSAALSVMSLDQLTEGIAKLTVLLIVSWITPLPPLMKKGILGLIVIIFLFMSVLLFFSFRFHNYKEIGVGSGRTLKERAVDFVSRWGHQLEGLRNFQTFFLWCDFSLWNEIGRGCSNLGNTKGFRSRSADLERLADPCCIEPNNHYSISAWKHWSL